MIRNIWFFKKYITFLCVLIDYDNPIFEKFGKGGTYPRRYHISYHHQDYNDGKFIRSTTVVKNLANSKNKFGPIWLSFLLKTILKDFGS